MKLFNIISSAIILGIMLAGCGSNGPKKSEGENHEHHDTESADDEKGKGKFTEVPLSHPIDQAMVTKGKSVYDVKCMACHKLTGEKLVGPGWKGVTDRRKPEWIMNFVTNTDEMIDKDPAAQALLEQCMVRMPNQHLSDEEARNVLEFMRNNDGKN
jgi:mono/diheme cytochrome c family protein